MADDKSSERLSTVQLRNAARASFGLVKGTTYSPGKKLFSEHWNISYNFSDRSKLSPPWQNN
jgi:hypothetical protein